jgi:hypothetical protein
MGSRSKRKPDEDTRKIALDKEAKDLDNEVMRYTPPIVRVKLCKECSAEYRKLQGEKITVRSLCLDALKAPVPSDQRGEAPDPSRRKRFVLATKIAAAGKTMQLKNEDLIALQKVVEEQLVDPIQLGRVLEVLDPEGLKEE